MSDLSFRIYGLGFCVLDSKLPPNSKLQTLMLKNHSFLFQNRLDFL